jgi:hypothetical protein
MMKTKNPRNKTKLGWFASAALLGTLATQAQAQSSDALIDKLVEKGILTANEAKDLRDEADNDFKTAFQTKTGMPDWVTGYRFSGDFRGRFDQITSDNTANIDRVRLRYRLRVGLAVNMTDNLEAGFRLASGSPQAIGSSAAVTGSPLSNNTTLQDNFSKKMIYIDTAYGKWTPVAGGNWLVSATIGKMDNPFSFTPMVFDPDLTPEGAVLQASYAVNDKQSLSATAAAFVLDEESSTTSDPLLYGGQILWNAKWTDKLSSTLGAGMFAIVSADQLTPSNVPYVNQGNTRIPVLINNPNGTQTTVNELRYNYTPMIADASVTYTLDSFPFYNGAFPIKATGEYMHNAGAPKDNQGYWTGITFGKASGKKTWDISYRYEYLGADAWYDQLVDDDNGAYYAATPSYSSASSYSAYTATAGWIAGTNIKGHLIKFNYCITDSFTFTVSCFLNELINRPPQATPKVDLNSAAIHVMADLMWRF